MKYKKRNALFYIIFIFSTSILIFKNISFTIAASSWQWVYPYPQGNHLFDIDFDSANSIWAVGDAGTIIHYDGTKWNVISTQHKLPLNAIDVYSANKIWVVGDYGFLTTYDGTKWTIGDTGWNQFHLSDVYIGNASNIYVCGNHYVYSNQGILLKFNGMVYEKVEIGHNRSINAIDGIGANSIWLAGAPDRFGDRGITYFNGSSWTQQTVGKPGPFNDIFALSNQAVWAVGDNGTIVFFNGSNWTVQNCPTSADLLSVYAYSVDKAWAVGTGGIILSYNGSEWKLQNIHQFKRLNGVIAPSANDIWVVGNQGTIIHNSGTDWQEQTIYLTPVNLYDVLCINENMIWAVGEVGSIFRFDGYAWSKEFEMIGKKIYSIHGKSPIAIWAVGTGGLILHFDGNKWEVQNSGTTADLYGVFSPLPNKAWAVGANGLILHYNGSEWRPQASGIIADIKGIYGLNESNIWAVGAGGVLLYYDGSKWSLGEKVTNNNLLSFYALATDFLIGVGEIGTIIYYNGFWHSSSGGPRYNDVAMYSKTKGWIAGELGTLLSYNGNIWQGEDNHAGGELFGVDFLNDNAVYSVGANGTIIFYGPPIGSPRPTYTPYLTPTSTATPTKTKTPTPSPNPSFTSTPTPTETPLQPKPYILLAGYWDTRLYAGIPGNYDIMAVVSDPAGGDLTLNIPLPLYSHSGNIYIFWVINGWLPTGLPPSRNLVELYALSNGRQSYIWPYLTVLPK